MTTLVDTLSDDYPYSGVVYIESTFAFGVTYRGSGAVVGPNDVLTASHLVYNAALGGAATSIRVIPGSDKGSQPFGAYYADVSNYYTVDPDGNGAIFSHEVSEDVAILGFSENIGSLTGWFSLDSGYSSGPVNVTGYPGTYTPQRMTNDTGSVTYNAAEDLYQFLNIEVVGGNSGGPVWYQGASGPSIVGVVSTMSWAADLGSHFSQLVAWLGGNDYLMGGGGPVSTRIDIFRFYNSQTGAHFYTASAQERDTVIATLPQFHYEGNAFDSTAIAPAGIDIFRFYNPQTNTHFYTASVAERDNVIATLPVYQFEGVAYRAFAAAGGGAHEALYRFYNTANSTHFYTASEAERDQVIATLPQYHFEGTAYYVDLA